MVVVTVGDGCRVPPPGWIAPPCRFGALSPVELAAGGLIQIERICSVQVRAGILWVSAIGLRAWCRRACMHSDPGGARPGPPDTGSLPVTLSLSARLTRAPRHELPQPSPGLLGLHAKISTSSRIFY